MNFSIKQYTLLFILILILSGFLYAYKINLNLANTQKQIQSSRATSAADELSHALQLTTEHILQSAKYLSEWQEVRQQLDNPDIFAYWYNVRFKKHAFDLQKYTADFMIYNASGTALSKLDDVSLPYNIKQPDDIKSIIYQVINNSQLIYVLPIFSKQNNSVIIGYLSSRLNYLPLIKSSKHFQYLEPDTLTFTASGYNKITSQIKTEQFSYNLHTSDSIVILENLIKESILELILIIIAPTIILLLCLLFFVGRPIQGVVSYINHLRTASSIISKPYKGKIQVKELNAIYDSLYQYHSELKENEERLSLTLNSIGDAVITTDQQLKVIRMNPVAERLTGWCIEDAQSQPLNTIFSQIDSASGKPIDIDFSGLFKTKKSDHQNNDTLLISKDGIVSNIARSTAPILDLAGNAIGLVLVFNDITEQKLKDEQLQHSLKMDALGKLTGGIAHDFNNMISIIMGYSELLELTLEKHSDEYSYVKEIHTAGDRARKLTSKLLTFSRKSRNVKSVHDINALILSDQNLLAKTLTPRIDLQLLLNDDLWPVLIEQNLFQDALLNICINSMHAMPDGGSLTIETKNLYLDKIDQIYTDLEQGDYILCSIIDTGYGMDKETRLKIFDPFFTTKGEKGTGLGMSQVYGFVKQSGGYIHVYSEPGHGTKISLYLPRAHQNDIDSSDITSQVSDNTTKTKHANILVVDDEVALVDLSCKILEQAGYTVIKAESAEEAIEQLNKHKIDLLLTDVIMPEMDGYELAQLVTKKYPTTKIQLVSGFSGDINPEHGSLDADILSKPFTAAELLNRVRQLLEPSI